MNEHYPFKLIPLSYAYDALEPFIDEKTMKLHHDKHLGKYVDELNKVLEGHPEFHEWTLEKLLFNLYSLPEEIRVKVKNNAGGVFNHNMFFSILGIGHEFNLSGNLGVAIKGEYRSFENFLGKLKEAAMSVFGSGYAFVVIDRNGRLRIITTKNQETALEFNLYPILLIDVWEHAYYLKYNNRRDEYIDNLFKVINWDKVEENYIKFFNYQN